LADGCAINRWYQGLTAKHGLSPGTAVRHFNVMHHMIVTGRDCFPLRGRFFSD